MPMVVKLVARDTGGETLLTSAEKHSTVNLTQPSVLVLKLSPGNIARTDRASDDLLLYLKDGTVLRCKNFFSLQHGQSSVLVLEDASGSLMHAEMDAERALVDGVVELDPWYESISNIDPYIAESADTTGFLVPLLGGLLCPCPLW